MKSNKEFIDEAVKNIYETLDKELPNSINNLNKEPSAPMSNFVNPDRVYSGILNKYINVKTGEIIDDEQ